MPKFCIRHKLDSEEWTMCPLFGGSTVEPLNKGHFGANSFVPCREVVPISEVLAWCCNKCPL